MPTLSTACMPEERATTITEINSLLDYLKKVNAIQREFNSLEVVPSNYKRIYELMVKANKLRDQMCKDHPDIPFPEIPSPSELGILPLMLILKD